MKNLIFINLIAVLIFITVNITNADQAKKENDPLPENYQQMIEENIKEQMLDPDSTKFKYQEKMILGDKWICYLTVNSKNRFGGYVGFEKWQCEFKDGKLIKCYKDPFEEIKRITGNQ